MKVLILYYSKSGHTLEAANATAEGIRLAGSEVDIVAVNNFEVSMLTDYDGIIIGSPCWAGSITSSGVAKPIVRVINSLPENRLKGKRCGGISVYAKKGGQTTVKHLGELMAQKGCEDYKPGPSAKAGVPMSLWKGPSVGTEDKANFKAFGIEFVA
ncbi:MAG: flavodoxin family protein [Sedimentisphaeraceae bacterium JB056]